MPLSQENPQSRVTDGPVSADPSADAAERKRSLRRTVSASRALLDESEIRDYGVHLATTALQLSAIADASCVAAYVSVDDEPDTGPLLAGLRERFTRVLLPVLCDDGDLDWAEYTGPDELAPGPHGLMQPTGERLGLEAIAEADVVLVPGLATDCDGERLGRGGGSYDRALARVGDETPVWVVLYDDEIGLSVPGESHDVRVRAALTAQGLEELTGG